MPKTLDQVQGFLGTSSQRSRLVRGEDVEVHLDSGEVFDGTISSLRSRTSDASRITARSKRWSRWKGTPDDLVTFAKRATATIGERTSENPAISIRVGLRENEEERYFAIEAFEQEIKSSDAGAPGARLKDIQQVEVTVGPTQIGAYKAIAMFSQGLPAPGVVLAMEGADRPLVNGLTDELSALISAGRPRVPAMNGFAQMLVGGLLGAAYAIAFFSIDWGFLPDWMEIFVVLILYLLGFIGLLYSYAAATKLLLPPLDLAHLGQKRPIETWRRRILSLCGALALAAFPFVLEQVFGK